MTFRLYDAAVPVFDATLADMSAWLDMAREQGADEAAILEARLAPDMLPFPRQIQIACDTANLGAARLAGVKAQSFPDTETTFDELKARIAGARAAIGALDPSAFDDAAEREVEVRQRDGTGWRWTGAQFLTQMALPNLFFHATTTYALLRANGVAIGKADFLRHRGPTTLAPAA